MKKSELEKVIKNIRSTTFWIAAVMNDVKNDKSETVIISKLRYVLDQVNEIYDDLRNEYENKEDEEE